MHFQDREHR